MRCYAGSSVCGEMRPAGAGCCSLAARRVPWIPLKADASPVAAALASLLGLTLPDTPWHSQRDRLLEVGAWFAGPVRHAGQICERFFPADATKWRKSANRLAEGRGGSSTMPHKRNPIACSAILTAAQRTPGLVATLYAGQIQQHERALAAGRRNGRPSRS
ncbi:3-carboxy-cis,cis-muconate cycloisomerase [Raoultella ornithinolytica]|nr:3-carboxy-cis,cis-muconate cycloisomerase [Raoultella ornithinolytica]